MKISKRIIALILSAAMVLSTMMAAASATWLIPDQVIAPNYDNDVSVMSLLPLEELPNCSVSIDRFTDGLPDSLRDQPEHSFLLYEALGEYLFEQGYIETPDTPYDGIIMCALDGDDYYEVAWDGVITCPGRRNYCTIKVLLNEGDQLNPDGVKFTVNVTIRDSMTEYVSITRTVDDIKDIDSIYDISVREIFGEAFTEAELMDSPDGTLDGTITTVSIEPTELSLDDVLEYDPNSSGFAVNVTNEKTSVRISVNVSMSIEFVNTLSDGAVKVINSDGSEGNVLGFYTDLADTSQLVYESRFNRGLSTSVRIATQSIEENAEAIKVRIVPSSSGDVSNMKVYSGIYTDESELTSDSEDITSQILGDGYTIKLQEFDYVMPNGYSYKYSTYMAEITYVFERTDGTLLMVPGFISLQLIGNYVYLDVYADPENTEHFMTLYSNPIDGSANVGITIRANVFMTDSFENITGCNIIGRYTDYTEENPGYYEEGYDKIKAAYVGRYSKEEIETLELIDIKEQLFDKGYVPDFSSVEPTVYYSSQNGKYDVCIFEFTIVDIYDEVRNAMIGIAIPSEYTEPEPVEPTPSSDTNLSITNVLNSEGVSSYIYRKVPYSYDSQSDIYETLFILNRDGSPVTDETVIPVFDIDSAANAFVLNDEGASVPAESGKTPVSFHSGKAIQYEVKAEDLSTENTWVTFVTQQKGPALFVNGANNIDKVENMPVRELFIGSTSSDDYHDILIANVGDTELTDIEVNLNASGVVLDDYWTVIDGTRKLAPFDSVSSSEMSNMAKIRLNPETDEFQPISGTLTVSAADCENVVIKLTGFVGRPAIQNTSLYTGVKYVPYSSIIMTNSRVKTDMKFSIIAGELPDGITLLDNGELYGMPTESGTFPITIKAEYVGDPSIYAVASYNLTILDNTDENVEASNHDEEGYEVTDYITKTVYVLYSSVKDGKPVISRVYLDSDLFRSVGSYENEFLDFYFHGEKLVEGVDYIAEEGSTKITILDETFSHVNLGEDGSTFTISAEFRTSEDKLKHSSQNINVIYVSDRVLDFTIPSYGNSLSSSSINGSSVSDATSSNAVTCFMNIVDASGNPVSNLSLELHSDPQFAVTDGSGVVVFNNVGFGRHTLSAKDGAGNITATNEFSLVSGEAASVEGDIVTAEFGKKLLLNIMYDGSRISILSAQTYVDVEAPTEQGETEEDPTEDPVAEDAAPVPAESNPTTAVAFALLPLVISAAAAIALKKR